MALTPEFQKRYDFDWEVLDVIIGGQSAIDSGTSLCLRTPEEAARFMDCYGYDIENPIEKAELFGNFQEALSFIRRYFLQPENPEGIKLEIPRKISELTDLTQLLLLTSASGPSQRLTALWACAIIKIMHTIAHMDKDLRSNYFADIQQQILDRFYKFIHRDERDQMYLGRDARDADRVDLMLYESKPKKSRDSVILKLLHKPENVAEDIFDRVGIRFVTQNRFDALRVIKFLKDRYVVMPANIKPSRSRNTLLDVKAFRAENSMLLRMADAGEIAPGELHQRLIEFCERNDIDGASDGNPHSSRDYRALQFTCRQLVKIKNPLYDELKAVKGAMRNSMKSSTSNTTASGALPEEVAKIVERIDLRNVQKEIRFFYPFEVQVFDEKSHQENLAGRSSHTNYKKSQIQAAMRRVLGELMRFTERGSES